MFKAIRRWLFGRKYCMSALISTGEGWTPVKRYFWRGGLFTRRKINVMGILLGRATPKGGIVYLDDLQLNRLGVIETIKVTPHEVTPQFIWPKGLWGDA